jgi:hypothetical protein
MITINVNKHFPNANLRAMRTKATTHMGDLVLLEGIMNSGEGLGVRLLDPMDKPLTKRELLNHLKKIMRARKRFPNSHKKALAFLAKQY